MWGGWLDDAHILLIHIISTSQSSTLVLMGWDLEDTSISQTRSTWFMWGGWLDDTHILLIHIFSTSQSSTLVLMGWNVEDMSISQTRFTMVHVGSVAG